MTSEHRKTAFLVLLFPLLIAITGCAKTKGPPSREDGVVIDADAEEMLKSRGLEVRGFAVFTGGKQAYDFHAAAVDVSRLRIKRDPKDPDAILVGFLSRRGRTDDSVVRYAFGADGHAVVSPVNEPPEFYDRYFEGMDGLRNDGIVKAFEASKTAGLSAHEADRAIYRTKQSIDEAQSALDSAKMAPLPPAPAEAPAAPAAASAAPAGK